MNEKDIAIKSEQNVYIPKYKNLENNFNYALEVVEDIILKNFLIKLDELEVVDFDEKYKKDILAEDIRFFKINEMVYEQDENSTYKFASVFNTLASSEGSVFIIVDSDGEKTDFYMGISSLNSNYATHSLKDRLENALIGQFPGIKIKDYYEDEMREVISKISSNANNISSVSCIANNKHGDNENRLFIQGMEKLTLSMQGKKYTGIILANSTPQNQIVELRREYEKIYTQLSSFSKKQISYSVNSSMNLSEAVSRGDSKSITDSSSKSIALGTSSSWNKSTSKSISKENTTSKLLGAAATVSNVLMAGALATTGVGAAVPLLMKSSMAVGVAGNLLRENETTGESQGYSESKTETNTKTETVGKTETKTENITNNKGIQQGNSENITLTIEDKTITSILERIEIQLKRLQEFESIGMWECAAYFLSENSYISEIAASTYKALMIGEKSGTETSAINNWDKNKDKKEVETIYKYIKNFVHPEFIYETLKGEMYITPSTFVSGNELALHMGLPRRSVCGFPVIKHADFGKEVVSYNESNKNKNAINLGKIFNMGIEYKTRVKLDINSLAMHTFITGATGSGKSNTIYELIRQLDNAGINFMVIEPTKGEYKNIFGGRKDVTVLGTNPQYSRLLRINPFKFSEGIHVLEHVDRIVDIFNVCWPMYAAMPAILKDAILESYKVSGWDLTESKNKIMKDLFPTFLDLKNELINVIDSSGYSEEVKSNYRGSLITRVNSLTNGLNGEIFSSNEIDNEKLFDENIIIDISRIGSLETKSLIMGILIMRLNEHRMSNNQSMNIPLKHVTVLEEAHNILKAESFSNNSEGSNTTGKSVEMISNAIAEMRTYGEGFIIADQSPTAVDISAIKNTNTKITMRLPEENDRRIAGKSAALKDEQLDEIVKLPKGVAVVYQNDWLEPILCKVNKFSEAEKKYVYDEIENNFTSEEWVKTELLKLLVKGRVNENVDIDIEKMRREINYANFSSKNKLYIYQLLEEYEKTAKLLIWKDENFKQLSTLVTEILECRLSVESIILKSNDFNELNIELKELIDKKIENISNEIYLTISQCLMKECSEKNSDNLKIYVAWYDNVKRRGGMI
ncbi:ATP-binding protein [Fusobacterium varium]|uniref:ATP-binding protein n=1 Tax=Fusobacterium varium TaxID=856 RepID=UPI003563B4B0